MKHKEQEIVGKIIEVYRLIIDIDESAKKKAKIEEAEETYLKDSAKWIRGGVEKPEPNVNMAKCIHQRVCKSLFVDVDSMYDETCIHSPSCTDYKGEDCEVGQEFIHSLNEMKTKNEKGFTIMPKKCLISVICTHYATAKYGEGCLHCQVCKHYRGENNGN